MIKSLLSLLSLLTVALQLQSQVVLDPFFATQTDTVTILYDASQGNAALEGITQVYAHTGVITSNSTGPTDWQHVVGNWGTADPTVAMTSLGNDLHELVVHIPTFYGISSGEEVYALAFVFRNADGSVVGRSANGGDIFVDLFTGGYAALLTEPTEASQLLISHDSINVKALASEASSLKIFVDDSLCATATNATTLAYDFHTSAFGNGGHHIWLEATSDTNTIRDSAFYLKHQNPAIANPPGGMKDGINYLSDTSVLLQFSVPFKNFIYVVGDFNDWQLHPDYLMHKSTDNNTHWLVIDGLDPGVEYRFQYSVDEEQLRVADVFAEKILDPWNDGYIDESTYPNLIEYPHNKTTDAVAVLQCAKPPYDWDESISYERPAQSELVIYELLLRDYLSSHDYSTLIDTLDYLERLGVNAIELMPFNEFEGNESWGYNPSFYFAPDKYYGPADSLKKFIEEAHRRGIAVIMDMVLNHSFGQNPQVRLFFDPTAGQYGQPTAQNPWFLETAAHDFNVGYDYNHESPATKAFVDRVMRYWMEEYKVDGYRMDLSKGFTSNITIGNPGAMAQYDASRIAILKRMADKVWEVDSAVYIILEHFAENSEETELSNYGFMLWGNSNHDFSEALMGYGANLASVSHQSRGWNDAHLVGYSESHDEERLVYKMLEFGDAANGYNTKDLTTALSRAEMSAVFLLGIPGPKMIWQFGEMGYDYSINHCPDGTISESCRLSNKPIRWDYLEDHRRRRVFDTYAAMNALRNEHPVFHTDDFELDLSNDSKVIRLNHQDMNVVIVGNFDVVPHNVQPQFQHAGTWFDYFSGATKEVLDVNEIYELAAGEFHIYTDVALDLPDITAGIETQHAGESSLALFPNPSQGQCTISAQYTVTSVLVRNLSGKVVHAQNCNVTKVQLDLSHLAPGSYFIEATTEEAISVLPYTLLP